MSGKRFLNHVCALIPRLTARCFVCLLLISLLIPGANHLLLDKVLDTANAAESASRTALWLDIDGVIGPATKDYITRSLDNAAQNSNIELVILRMDTPGGLDISMRSIIQHILSSPVPVVTYVSPSGAVILLPWRRLRTWEQLHQFRLAACLVYRAVMISPHQNKRTVRVTVMR